MHTRTRFLVSVENLLNVPAAALPIAGTAYMYLQIVRLKTCEERHNPRSADRVQACMPLSFGAKIVDRSTSLPQHHYPRVLITLLVQGLAN